ncbi:hypothetical protein MAUB_51230 [Mycolicibacterium aubagnense]|uniref:Transposase n=1 Tax=Mycolicibacterium aubagnense TaxID=319707 RepID=A0ABN5YZC8_9MYCO|nr:hypothetical protein MAUB_51230 [Mycolicibacterium aubagnense]
MTGAEAARRAGGTTTLVTKWKQQFLEGPAHSGCKKFPAAQPAPNAPRAASAANRKRATVRIQPKSQDIPER